MRVCKFDGQHVMQIRRGSSVLSPLTRHALCPAYLLAAAEHSAAFRYWVLLAGNVSLHGCPQSQAEVRANASALTSLGTY